MASEVAKSLHEREQRLWNEIQNMHKTVVEENRSFNADETIKFENLHAEIDKVDTQLRSLLDDEKRAHEASNAYDEFAKRSQSPDVPAKTDNVFASHLAAFASSEARSIDIAPGGGVLKRLMSRTPTSPAEARAVYDNYLPGGTPGNLTPAVNSGDGGIVPVDFYSQLISYLVEVSGVMQTGPTVINTQGGEPMQIPVVAQHTGYGTAGAPVTGLGGISQGGTLPQADPSFSQKTLTSNKFGIMIQVPREMIDDSGVNLLGYLAMSAGRAVGNTLGNAIVNGGNGISGGLVAGAPSVVTAASSGLTYENLVDVEYNVIAPYRQSKSCYWLAADKTLGSLRKLVDANGRPLWEPSTVLGAPDLLLGKPLVADPFMPALGTSSKSILFGDFSQLFIRLVGGVRFERSDDFAFNEDLVSFRALLRADSNLIAPASTNPQPVVGLTA